MKKKPSKPEDAGYHALAAHKALQQLFGEPASTDGVYASLAHIEKALDSLFCCRRSIIITAVRNETVTQAALARHWGMSRAAVSKFCRDSTLF